MKVIAIFILSALVACPIFAKLEVSGRKDRVTPSDTRESFLEASSDYLKPSREEFLESIDDLRSPFLIEEEVVEKVVEPKVKIVYDDESVLKVIGANFVKEIRGTMTRGSKINLQLKGGRLVQPGYRFPVRIPEIEDETFAVTITEITTDGVGLRVSDVERFFFYEEDDGRDSIKKDAP